MSKKLFKTFVLALPLALLFFAGCGRQIAAPQGTTSTVPGAASTTVEINMDTSTWKTFTDDEFGFSFKYPEYMGVGGFFNTSSFEISVAQPPSEEGETDGYKYFSVIGSKYAFSDKRDSPIKKYLTIGNFYYVFNYEYAGGKDLRYLDFFDEFIKNFKDFPVNVQIIKTSNWKEFKSDYFGFSLMYPPEWKLYFQNWDGAQTTSSPSSSARFDTIALGNGKNVAHIWPIGVPGNAWDDFVIMHRTLIINGRFFEYYLSSDNIYYFTSVEYNRDEVIKTDFGIVTKNADDLQFRRMLLEVIRTIKFQW